jgi:hypothetical protein
MSTIAQVITGQSTIVTGPQQSRGTQTEMLGVELGNTQRLCLGGWHLTWYHTPLFTIESLELVATKL